MNLLRLLAACTALALLPSAAAQASVPGASTGPATNVTSDSATLTGVVNPNKEETTYYFEYGTTTAYGARTPDATVGGNAGKEVEATITGLAPSTVYHFRLVATNPSGSDFGADMTFTTAASPYTLPPTITIAAVPAAIRFGGSSTISGQLTNAPAGTTVTLQQSPHPFSAFTDLATATTDAAGNYSFTVTPGLNTRYRVVAQSSPPATSAEVTVLVRYRVSLRLSDSTVRRGQRVRFKGSVAPAHDGRKVKIQRKTSTGFKTVAKAVLRAAKGDVSKYANRIRITRKGTYRVRVAADADHATGFSPRRKIRIGS
jgi:hypothetical protein